jgi:hypothetical protein
LRFSALPKRWIKVTAPHCPVFRVRSALWIARYTIRNASPIAAELLANKKRTANGTLSTH